MYSGHIIIQGCQPRPFEGNKYPELYTIPGLNFVWTHSRNERRSRSFIRFGELSGGECEIKSFYTNNNHKRHPDSKMLCHVQSCGPIPGLFGALQLITGRGRKLYHCTRMMDDKLNLCPGTEGEWWQRYLSWEWRLGVRRGWVPKGTRHWQIYPVDPIAWAFSLFWIHWLSDPHRSCCQCVKNTPPCICWCL